jgi:hypothetical protein
MEEITKELEGRISQYQDGAILATEFILSVVQLYIVNQEVIDTENSKQLWTEEE